MRLKTTERIDRNGQPANEHVFVASDYDEYALLLQVQRDFDQRLEHTNAVEKALKGAIVAALIADNADLAREIFEDLKTRFPLEPSTP